MIGFRFYAITNRELCYPNSLKKQIEILIKSGVSAFQLREKDLHKTELKKIAEPIAQLCKTNRVKLFINSLIDVAIEIDADGVHLPESRMGLIGPAKSAGLMIGCSVHDLDTAIECDRNGSDFITYSPIFETQSKPTVQPVGLINLRRIVSAVSIPVFALGGITPKRVRSCLENGAFGVAVMSGVMSAENGSAFAKTYLEKIEVLK